jgi:hypothetical protein
MVEVRAAERLIVQCLHALPLAAFSIKKAKKPPAHRDFRRAGGES